MRQIDQYIETLVAAKTPEQVFAALRHEIAQFGIEWFTYELYSPAQGSAEIFSESTYPRGWIDRYASQRYSREDVVITEALRSTQPFLWPEARDQPHLTATQRHVFREAAEFGLKAGGTIPLHGPTGISGCFSMANNSTDEEFDRLFKQHRHPLQIVAAYAHEKLVKLGIGKKHASFSLSPREAEVLTWTALGCSAWEISEKLGISSHTVKEHLDRAKEKLGARNKTHAASIAIMHGLIRL